MIRLEFVRWFFVSHTCWMACSFLSLVLVGAASGPCLGQKHVLAEVVQKEQKQTSPKVVRH